ncbi:hypothetical protein ACH5RR_034312 [Cinchona calisaya]|uniref:TF-B3 domain-containing protein n=1 Tax=Cinchona calisaya TaxID=153742 RepID=A0ABD2YAJ9_9GENT
MKRAVFYHFLSTKAKEEENKRKRKDPHVHEWEVVEKRAHISPVKEFLCPWEIKYVITTKDLGPSFELSPGHVWEHIFKHWHQSAISRLTIDGEKLLVTIRDMDTSTNHNLIFSMCKDTGRFTIQGDWYKDFVERRNLKEGMLVGLYWDRDSSSLHFSVLDNLGN